MKYFIFKTLDNNNITIKIAPRNIIQLVLGNEKIAEYSKKEIIQQPPLVDVVGTTVKLNFGRDQWGREVPTIEENGVPLYRTKNGSHPEYAVKQAAGIVIFFGALFAFFGIMGLINYPGATLINIILTVIGLTALTLAYFIRKYNTLAVNIFLGITAVIWLVVIYIVFTGAGLWAIIELALITGFLISANNARYGVQIAHLQDKYLQENTKG